MARLAGKMRADLRAMEIQANDTRTNPIRGGAGATPSMGLSQFRGGAVPDHISAAPRRVVGGASRARGARGSGGNESESDEEVDGGAHHGESASRMADATAMGLHLGQHLHSLHGAGFFSRFKKGFSKVGKTLAKGAEKGLAVVKKVNDFREKHIEPVVRSVLPYLGPKGAMLESALKAKDVVKNLTTMLPEGKAKNVIKAVGFGGSMYPSGAYEGQGRESDDIETMEAGSKMDKKLAKHAKAHPYKVEGGKKRRAPASPSDGRRKRADIVKKVMADKGMKMIEASKYVKAHNLY